jgi:hypothetical protein
MHTMPPKSRHHDLCKTVPLGIPFFPNRCTTTAPLPVRLPERPRLARTSAPPQRIPFKRPSAFPNAQPAGCFTMRHFSCHFSYNIWLHPIPTSSTTSETTSPPDSFRHSALTRRHCATTRLHATTPDPTPPPPMSV